jgi:hypothetical protein
LPTRIEPVLDIHDGDPHVRASIRSTMTRFWISGVENNVYIGTPGQTLIKGDAVGAYISQELGYPDRTLVSLACSIGKSGLTGIPRIHHGHIVEGG